MITNAAKATAADRATLQQLKALCSDLDKPKQSLASRELAKTATAAERDAVRERISRIQRLLREMGLDDPERFSRRLPLLRAMGMTEAEWKPLQVMIEQGAFAAVPHPGMTAIQPVMTNSVVDHLIHPHPTSGNDFVKNGLYGGHETSNLRVFLGQHPEFELVQLRTSSSGGTTYREYRQYSWRSSSATPPPIGDPHRPGGSAFGPAEQALWDVARVPKTTADNMQAYLRDAETAWEQWRSSGFSPGPPPSGPATQPGSFTTSASRAGVAFEGGFVFNAGPPPTWHLNTIYPKL
jgi:hypothetical protein